VAGYRWSVEPSGERRRRGFPIAILAVACQVITIVLAALAALVTALQGYCNGTCGPGDSVITAEVGAVAVLAVAVSIGASALVRRRGWGGRLRRRALESAGVLAALVVLAVPVVVLTAGPMRTAALFAVAIVTAVLDVRVFGTSSHG
jgi:hypothetical protein